MKYTEEQQKNIRDWQSCGLIHPLTCGNDSTHRNLEVNENGLYCLDCDYTQTWIPACCFHGIQIKTLELPTSEQP